MGYNCLSNSAQRSWLRVIESGCTRMRYTRHVFCTSVYALVLRAALFRGRRQVTNNVILLWPTPADKLQGHG